MASHPVEGSTLLTVQEQRHPPVLGLVGFRLSLTVPVTIGIAGAVIQGLEVIDWPSAILWGAVAATAFAMAGTRSRALGLTRLEWSDLLGSIVATPGGRMSRSIGLLVQQVTGAVLAVIWIYASGFAGQPANWITGMAFGGLLWLPGLLMMSTLRSVHPAIRRGAMTDPGPAALKLGRLTPLSMLVGLLVYGAVLGLGYQFLPIDVTTMTAG